MSSTEPRRCYHCGEEVRIQKNLHGTWRPYNLDDTPHNCAQYHRNTKRNLADIDFPDIPRDIVNSALGNRTGVSSGPNSAVESKVAEAPGEAAIEQPTQRSIDSTTIAPYQAEPTATADLAPASDDPDNLSTPDSARRGPAWTREEIILATDLYVRHQGVLFGPDHPDVKALSNSLKRLPFHPTHRRNPKFRNPNGVAMKLSNIRAVDPYARSKGSAHGSKLDGLYWTELRGNPSALEREVAAIKGRYPEAFAPEQKVFAPVDDHRSRPSARAVRSRQTKETFSVRPFTAAKIQEQEPAYVLKDGPSWKPIIEDIQQQAWFREIRKDDLRFDWFTRKFRGYVKPRLSYLHEWITAITSSSQLVGPDRPDVEETLILFGDYVTYIHELSLEDELFTIVSASTLPNYVNEVVRELGWDAGNSTGTDVGLRTSMVLHAIHRGWFWTPALDRALIVLAQAGVHDTRLIGPTLKQHGVTLQPSMTAQALRIACKAFGKQPPAILEELSDG